MIKFDLLDYAVYQDGNHIADFDNLDHAKFFANTMAINKETDTVIISNFTGEVCGEFVVKTTIQVVEVEP